jgi:hypothetical protein
MTNAAYPDFANANVLKTTNTKILGQVTSAIAFITTKEIGSTISFILKAKADNTPIKVDFGDGSLVNDTIGTYEVSITDTLIGSQTLIIYGSDITYFNCDDIQLILLDISNDTALKQLSCEYNQLTSLDLSKNPALYYIDCSHNQLISLNVSNDTALKILYCDFNKLTFATLPLEQASWTDYNYAPQQLIFIVKNIITGVELDLSSQLTVDGNITIYTWKTQSGTPLVEGTDYTITCGKTVFLLAQEDSVYCEMTNAAFPAFAGSDVLKTTNTKVKLYTSTEDILSDGLDVYSYYKTICIKLPYNAQLSIFDTNGRLVMSRFINSGTNNIQLQNTGVYLVKLISNMGTTARKVFVE